MNCATATSPTLQFAYLYPAPKRTYYPVNVFRTSKNGVKLKVSAFAAISSYRKQDAWDPEFRAVIELATESELYELQRILFGPSYFSPFLKSIMNGTEVDPILIEQDIEERELFISALESRFLFLAADARSTLRGWRPSYRDVLLDVRKKLNIHCSNKLSTEDLEIEIFLHLLHDCSSEEGANFSDGQGSLELGVNQWKVQALGAMKIGAQEIRSLILKGGSMVTLGRLYQLVARKLSGNLCLEAANFQIKKEILKKGGQLAAINVESRAAFLVAKQGFVGAASRYLGLRSMMTLLGPIMWGTFLADVVIQMLGTDYARILRVIYALAQIRVNRSYRLSSDAD